MGAEQIGYLVKGPINITAGRIKAAVNDCRRQRRELLALADKDAERHERMDAALSDTGEYFDPADIPENPEPDISAFVEWWHATDSRDTCYRSDPDNRKQKLVYAGDMSWGDEPDGRGYQALKRAFAWGFAEALGIR